MAAGMKGKALYDFQGDASLNELSFKTGDEIIVLRQVCFWSGLNTVKEKKMEEGKIEFFFEKTLQQKKQPKWQQTKTEIGK